MSMRSLLNRFKSTRSTEIGTPAGGFPRLLGSSSLPDCDSTHRPTASLRTTELHCGGESLKGFAVMLVLLVLVGCSTPSTAPTGSDVDPPVVDDPRDDQSARDVGNTEAPAPPLAPTESSISTPTPEAVDCKDAIGHYVELVNRIEAPQFGSEIHFDSANHGWLAQENPQLPSNSLYETADGGKSWNRRVTIPHGYIGDMHWSGAVGVLNGVDTSRSSDPVHMLVITRDGGQTWSVHPCIIAVTTVEDATLTGLYRGQPYLSTDGGGTWSRVYSPEGYFGVHLLPLEDERALAGLFSSGDGNQLFISRDSGFSWTPVNTLENPSQITVAADGSLWGVNARGLWVSGDAGASWSVRSFIDQPGQAAQDRSLRAVDEQTASVKLMDRPNFLFTSPGSNAWHTVSLPEAARAEGSYGFAFAGSHLCVVGDWRLNHRTGSSLWCSTDNGENWVNVSSFDSP